MTNAVYAGLRRVLKAAQQDAAEQNQDHNQAK